MAQTPSATSAILLSLRSAEVEDSCFSKKNRFGVFFGKDAKV